MSAREIRDLEKEKDFMVQRREVDMLNVSLMNQACSLCV